MASGDSRPILLPYQERWLNDKSPLKLWLAGRQIGKSFAVSMEAVSDAIKTRCNNLILSSSERQSREVMNKVYMHLRYLNVKSKQIIRAERETKEEVALPNGSRIVSLPANPDTVRGFSGNVFLDEFAFHGDSEEIWMSMYPTVTRGYKVRITSTPNGKSNMFYRLWTQNNKFSKHRTDIHNAVSEGLEVDVDSLKEGIGDPDGWAQEFECAFLDEATAFITYEMIAACEDEKATKDFLLEGGSVGAPMREFYLGVDVGRKKDLTVFWLWEKLGDVFHTKMVREMQNSAFRIQRDFLYCLLDGSFFDFGGYTRGAVAPLVRRCCIDSTGIGAQLAEEAVQRFGSRVEAVNFTSAVKEDLAITFKRFFEDRLLRIPCDKDIREDIHSVKRFSTSSGNQRFEAERSALGHADRFWAGALGIHAGKSQKDADISYESIATRGMRQGWSW